MTEHTDSPVDGSIDWAARQNNPVKRFLNGLERVTLLLERPVNRLVREPQFNPLYHTGTITVFLLILVAVTGVYLTMFFQFGFEASYQAVARVEISPIGRIMRALHRYASDLALLAALLHGYRTFFMDRFRGPRWLAWVTGVVSAALIWIIGVTGYWLVVDERAQLLTQSLIRVVGGWALGARFLLDNLLSDAAGAGWAPIMLVLIVHVGLSVAVGAFFVIHIRRLSRPKLAPPRFWIGAGGGDRRPGVDPCAGRHVGEGQPAAAARPGRYRSVLLVLPAGGAPVARAALLGRRGNPGDSRHNHPVAADPQAAAADPHRRGALHRLHPLRGRLPVPSHRHGPAGG